MKSVLCTIAPKTKVLTSQDECNQCDPWFHKECLRIRDSDWEAATAEVLSHWFCEGCWLDSDDMSMVGNFSFTKSTSSQNLQWAGSTNIGGLSSVQFFLILYFVLSLELKFLPYSNIVGLLWQPFNIPRCNENRCSITSELRRRR